MISINSNSSAMIAQNNLYAAQADLQDNMLQLSTGLRINSAADDAAGLQISNRMETQISGLDQAQRNANDAISMAQTAEGAMQETTDIMNRMRDLSLQSANDTNTTEDREAMQEEVDQLVAEVDRIAETTDFAGINLLDGSATDMTFQVGADANETISFGIDDMSADQLGNVEVATATDIEIMRNVNGQGDTSYYIEMEDAEGAEETIRADNLDDLGAEVETFLEDEFGLEGVEVAFDEDETVPGGEAKKMSITTDGGQTEDAQGNVASAGAQLTNAFANATDINSASVSGVDQNLNLTDIDLTTQAGAQQAIRILDAGLAKVDEERAELGAVQNRLESTIDNLSNIEENMTVSQSRILDADFAQQTTEMTSNQMLMQAGSSVLGQANSMPQYAVMLLG